MIVAMKKVHVVLLADRRETAVADLGCLGLVHVSERQVQSGKIEAIRVRQATWRKAVAILGQVAGKKLPAEAEVALSGEALVERIQELGTAIRTSEEIIEKGVKEESRLMPWGNFDPALIRDMVERGLDFQLMLLPSSDLAKIPEATRWMAVVRTKARSLILVFGRDVVMPPSAEPFELPECSLEERERLTIAERQKLAELKGELRNLLPALKTLEREAAAMEVELETAVVEASTQDDGAIAILEGFVPVDAVEQVRAWARETSWGLVISDPADDDRVPTLLRNPAPVRMLKPVLGFLGTVPGYQERDISHWFLIFLTIFFAMIIGDAAYGLLLLLIGIAAGIKIKASGKKVPEFVPLLITFSLATVAWGAMTGTWLALPQLAELPFLKQLQVPFLTGGVDARTLINPAQAQAWAGEETAMIAQKNIQLLCFVMGMGHLILAHVLRFFRELGRKPHIHAFAQLGWASVIFGAFFLVLNLVLDARAYPLPSWVIYVLAAGMGMVFLFEQQQGDNFFKGVLRALGNVITTALSGVSAFADVISYIRLFAVGLAGFAIAQSFNGMAEGVMAGGGFGVVGGVLIMLFGHTLNLIMGALSVVVHGVRLNMLEYSGHIGLEWTGFAYKPYEKKA